jgi:3-oxoacyl-[acyl-carrier-protein] synthase-3
MSQISRQVIDLANLSFNDISLIIPHQSNIRITEAIIEQLGLPQEKIYSNVERLGNNGAATIPIALDECIKAGRVSKNDKILLTAFGGGLTWGAAIVEL